MIEFVVIICTLGIALGQILFKLSANAARQADSFFATSALLWLIFALAVYGVATLVWVWVLQKADLGRVYPFMAVSFILVPLLSYFVFGERFSNYYFLGLGLVVVGLIVIARG